MTGAVAAILAVATATAAGWARDGWRAAPARLRAAALGGPASPSGTAGAGGKARPPATAGTGRLAARLADAGVSGPWRHWVWAWTGLTAATPRTARAGGPWLLLGTRRGRRGATVEAALPPVLEATARGLRAGASLPVALASAGAAASPTVAADLAGVAAAASRDGLVAALDRWAAERPLAGVRLAAAALALAAEVGGGGARALDGVALTLRQRQAAAGEVRALATQARLSAVVLTLAPVAFAALAAAGDPRTAAILLRSPVGQGCLAAGLSLDALGAAWMARITRAGAA